MYGTIGTKGAEFCVLYDDNDPCLHRLRKLDDKQIKKQREMGLRVYPPSIGTEYYLYPPRKIGGHWLKAEHNEAFVCGRHCGEAARMHAARMHAAEQKEAA